MFTSIIKELLGTTYKLAKSLMKYCQTLMIIDDECEQKELASICGSINLNHTTYTHYQLLNKLWPHCHWPNINILRNNTGIIGDGMGIK